MNKIAVIGAGVMGREIAYSFLIKGFKVYLNDLQDSVLKEAQEHIEILLKNSINDGFIEKKHADTVKKNIYYTSNIKEAVSSTKLVIEAVVEVIDVKISIFKELDEYCPKDTILATNTSTMSPTEIGAQTSRPDKCIAMHFFNPVHKMKLIEIVRGLETSDDTFNTVKNIGEKIGKIVSEVNEHPGFVTSRMNCLIGNEAMNMVMEGVATAENIDKAIKHGLNHPMGPLELADLVGLDSRLRNMEYLYETLGEKYRPSPILRKYVKAGKFGKKSGSGFYNYK